MAPPAQRFISMNAPHKRTLNFRNGNIVGLYQTQNLTDGQRIVVVFLFVHIIGVGLFNDGGFQMRFGEGHNGVVLFL